MADNRFFPVRSYAEGRGAYVDYDPNTEEAIVNQQRFKPADVGGYITEQGQSYAPAEYLEGLLGGSSQSGAADMFKDAASLAQSQQQPMTQYNTGSQFLDALMHNVQRYKSPMEAYPPGTPTFEARKYVAEGEAKAAEQAAKAKAEAAKQEWEREKFYTPYQYPTVGQQLEQGRWETKWPWEQSKYEYDINKPYFKPEDSGGKDATNQALASLSGYSSKQEAMADLQQYGSEMASQGVDMAKVLKAINELFPYE